MPRSSALHICRVGEDQDSTALELTKICCTECSKRGAAFPGILAATRTQSILDCASPSLYGVAETLLYLEH